MIENKGRSSWVECNSNKIIETARKLKACGLCLLHNHPRSVKDSPNVKPSQEDITFLREFINSIEGTGLKYLGNWITSNGHLNEILYNIQNNKNTGSESVIFTDSELASLLSPELKSVIQILTKTLLLQVNWHRISDKYFQGNKVDFIVKSFKYWGDTDEEWMFCMTAEDTNEGTSGDALTVEQAIKAYDAIIELQKVSSKLQSVDIEYTEVTVNISDKTKCGFYQTGVEQGAFWYIGSNQIFLKVTELACISDFIAAGLEKIDLIINQTSSN